MVNVAEVANAGGKDSKRVKIAEVTNIGDKSQW